MQYVCSTQIFERLKFVYNWDIFDTSLIVTDVVKRKNKHKQTTGVLNILKLSVYQGENKWTLKGKGRTDSCVVG